ncbi:MAG: hypothetical protein ACK5L3_02310 [Oscillospiraceae bacterium]
MLTMEFINVGYGDAVLVEETCPGGRVFRMLVDCGDTTPGAFYPGSQRTTAAEYLKKKEFPGWTCWCLPTFTATM